tara:strand:+ start:2215 stop:3267 length:1053 start_codon:yes stop_codon:yes gene_type:complete
LTFKKFSNLPIPSENTTFLIAEIGLNHNGNLNLCLEMVKEAAKSGASLIKLQKRDIFHLMTKDQLDKEFIKVPTFGTNQREVRLKNEFNFDEYKEIFNYSYSLGMIPFATAFDLKSLDFLCDLDSKIIKIASHSSSNIPLINDALERNLSLIISTGGLSKDQIIKLGQFLEPYKNQVCLMHCTSAYPCAPNEAFTDTISWFKDQFPDFLVGFSSHEDGFEASITAAILGATFIERHFTLSNAMPGFDHGISMEPREFKELALMLKKCSATRGIKKDILDSELPAKLNYHSGLYSRRDIQEGEIITLDDFDILQPLKSLENITSLEFGLKNKYHLKRTIKKGEQLKKNDIN